MVEYISLQQVADDLAQHPLLQDIPYERIINYGVEFMKIVGMPQQFEDKIATIEIKDWRGELPCDFLEMIQVKDSNGYVYRYTTDSFHMEHNDRRNYNKCGEYISTLEGTYKLQGNYIYTSNKEGIITIAYRTMALDEDGFPLIPDNGSFARALKAYIKVEWFKMLFDMSKITQQSMQMAQQDYAWLVGQAQSDLAVPSVDQMQSITNVINTLRTRLTEHDSGFINAGRREYLRKH